MKKIFLFLLLTTSITYAQLETPAPSPKGIIKQIVGLTEMNIEYSRPSTLGREVWGGLVPYGKHWRTGANENTVITFKDDVLVGGEKLAAGKYAIYTIPNKANWEVIFYKKTNNWGLPQPWDENLVALSTGIRAEKLPFPIETFTIMINNLTHNTADIAFMWSDVMAVLPVEVPTEEKTMHNIKEVMSKNPTAGDYYKAASYFLEEGKDIEQAYDWLLKATKNEKKAPFYFLRKRALVEAELGLKEKAIKTAKLSLEKAKKAGSDDYVRLNEASLKEWGAL